MAQTMQLRVNVASEDEAIKLAVDWIVTGLYKLVDINAKRIVLEPTNPNLPEYRIKYA